jgi:hypothetical protein
VVLASGVVAHVVTVVATNRHVMASLVLGFICAPSIV